MVVFIDFDDVIFNTRQFRAYLREFYAENGVSQELVQKYYYESDDNNPIRVFDPWGLFLRLEKYEKMNVDKLRENFESQLSDLKRFVFSDVESFLLKIGRESVHLVSFGLPSFQEKKIIGSGVNELVCNFSITGNLKAHMISRILKDEKINPEEKIIFIDDRVEQIEDVKKAFPTTMTIFLCREEGRYKDQKTEYCDFEAHSLEEAEKIIKELNSNG